MKRLTLFMLVLLALMVCSAAMAEDLSDRWGLGLTGGIMKPIGGENDYAAVDPFLGLWARRGLTNRWSFDGGVKFGKFHQGVEFPSEYADLTFDSFGGDYTKVFQAMLGARYYLNPEHKLSPYFGMHMGVMKWRVVDDNGSNDLGYLLSDDTVVGYDADGDPRELRTTNLTATATLGVEYFLASNAQPRFRRALSLLLISNDLDNIGASAVWGPRQTDANDGLLEAFAGLHAITSAALGQGQGRIPNSLDKLPRGGRGQGRLPGPGRLPRSR